MIKHLQSWPGIELWLYWHNEEAVAAVLTLQTGSTIGVHQLGVSPSHQGKGIAKNIMQFLMQRHRKQCDYMMLQASLMGQPLYQKLGFQPLFDIRNYQIPVELFNR